MSRRNPRTLMVAAVLIFSGAPLCLAAEPDAPAYPAGAAVFQANCAVCHGPKGTGQPSLAPPLTSYPARYASIAEGRRQLALTVLNGMFGGIDVKPIAAEEIAAERSHPMDGSAVRAHRAGVLASLGL